jgi:hypothetical protein
MLWVWIGILALVGIGVVWLVTAHVPNIVHVSGTVSQASDHYEGDEYDSTKISLKGDSRTFRLNGNVVHPSLPADEPRVDDPVDLWVDPGIDWFNVGTTEVFAISLVGDASPSRPAHTTFNFDDPNGALWRARTAGLLMMGIAALIIVLGAAWEYFADRRPADSPFPHAGEGRGVG